MNTVNTKYGAAQGINTNICTILKGIPYCKTAET